MPSDIVINDFDKNNVGANLRRLQAQQAAKAQPIAKPPSLGPLPSLNGNRPAPPQFIKVGGYKIRFDDITIVHMDISHCVSLWVAGLPLGTISPNEDGHEEAVALYHWISADSPIKGRQ